MKVICIDISNIIPCNHCGGTKTRLSEGGIYSASQCLVHKNSFEIKEDLYCIGCNHEQSYKKYRFIPLSNIDETKLVMEREENLVNI